MPPARHDKLARGLAAAAAWYCFGFDSIDDVLQNHLPLILPPFWHALAEHVWENVTTSGDNWRDTLR